MWSIDFPARSCNLMGMARKTPLQALTANRLRDGEVVYWSAGQWLTAFDSAQSFETEADAQAALAAADASVKACLVVAPYLFDVRRDAGGIHPVKEREIIRAAGPTVRHDLGKQAPHVPV